MKSFLGIFLYFVTYSQCAKILGVFPMSSYSHFSVGEVLMKELAERGHKVTMISPYPQKKPVKNFKDIDISSVIEPFAKNIKVHLEDACKMNFMQKISFYYTSGNVVVNDTLTHKNVQKLLNSIEKFDIIVLEQFMDEGLLYFAHHFKAPVIVLSTVGVSYINHYFTIPMPYSSVPHIYSSFGPEMNFIERIQNLIMSVYKEFYLNFVVLPKQNEILHECFPKAPHVKELMKLVHVVMVNSHSSFYEPFPLTPNAFEIGGFHVKPNGKLPQDIQEYLDNAKEGVVYFCLGTNLNPSQFSKKKIDIFVKSLSKLKQKILWKYEEDSIPNQPKNIKLIKWAPQQDILAHKNVKLFISHGGLLGIIEAVHFGVPILGIPFFADQYFNLAVATLKGFAISLSISELTEYKLTSALNEIINNSQYSKAAKEASFALHDRIVKPMDKAVYLVEYVMRHPNASYFKSAAMKLNWIQYHMLDVWLTFVTFLIILRKIIKWIYTKLNINAKKTKKKND